MATITPTLMTGSGARTATVTTLTASDTLTYTQGAILVIYNDTGSPITPNIVGDEATTVACPGVGEVDVSGGYDYASVADGEYEYLPLDSVSQYLTGTIALTGADGAEAMLLTFR